MPKAEKEVISYEETQTMINRIRNKRDAALVSCIYWSGRRISEVLSLDHTDIVERTTTDGTKTLIVTFNIRKKKKPLQIKTPFPVNDLITSNFTDWVIFHRTNYKNTKIFNITAQRAWQIMVSLDPDINDHWWRHVRATHLGTKMSPMELCAYFGWSDIKMALRYTSSNPDHVLNRMREL